MITRNRTRIIAALASATMKDFHSPAEREQLAKLYELMERNNKADKDEKPIEKTPIKRKPRKPKMFEAPQPEKEELIEDL